MVERIFGVCTRATNSLMLFTLILLSNYLTWSYSLSLPRSSAARKLESYELKSSSLALAALSPSERYEEPCAELYSDSKRNKFEVSTQSVALSLAVVLSTAVMGIAGLPSNSNADDFGRETEAPTLFTGENVMICTKRGPLGACLKTDVRTAENDNDKASKYMKPPDGEQSMRNKEIALKAAASEQEGSELIERLLRQTEENRAKNEKLVMLKTMDNDQAANFGPFDRETFIMNADGEGYTLLENPQAMRLKKAGYIKGKKFVTQPSQEVIDEALEGPGFGDMIRGFLRTDD